MEEMSRLQENSRAESSEESSKLPRLRRVGGRSLVPVALIAMMVTAFTGADAYAAGSIPTLGAAAPYSVLEAVVGANVGRSNLASELGLATNTSATSGTTTSSGLLGTGLLSGAGNLAGSLLGGASTHGGSTGSDSAALAAEVAAGFAYHVIAGESPTYKIVGPLNGVTLTPGIYAATGPLELAGRVLLDARGVANPHFIFQLPSDFTTAPATQIVLGAGVRASDVLWQIGGGTNVGTGTSLPGTILSRGPINLGLGAKLRGRAISLTGPVNLDRNSISLSGIGAVVAATSPTVSTAAGVVTPGTSAASPLSAGAGISLVLLPLHSLGVPTTALATVPTTRSSTSSGPAAPVPSTLPFIPIGDIGVPELAVPTVPVAGVGVPTVTPPLASSTSAPTAAAPSAAPTLPLTNIQLPALPTTPASTPVSGLSLPSLTLPSLGSSPASTSTPASGLSVPSITLPSITVPSVSPGSLALPNVSTASTPSGKGTLVHGRVRASSPTHTSSSSHVKSTSTTSPGSGSIVPLGAPQTGFGGMARTASGRFLLVLSALVVAACASTFAVRSRKYQRG
jgi:Ice-binding-like